MDKKMNEVRLDNCPACNSGDHPKYLESDGKVIERCRQCGLMFTNPQPTEDAIAKHFQEEYIEDLRRFENDFISLREASLQREAERLKAYYPAGARLLDVGTASGVFLSYFDQSKGWRVEGIEPSRYAARRASERWHVRVHQGFLREQGFKDACFDVVTSLDTFCFHPEPNKDLQEIARILQPGGIFAVEIPGLNFRLLKNTGVLSRLIYGVPAQLNPSVHLFFYSRSTLSLMLGKYGFELIRAWPEQSPVYGSGMVRWLNALFYKSSAAIYHLTGGLLNLAPKEFLLYRKK